MQKSSDPALEFIPGEYTDVIFVSSTKYGGPMAFAVVLALVVAGFLFYRRRRDSREQSS